MSGNLTLALLIGVLYTMGTYLLLQRTLTRVVIGLGLLSHGANLLLLQAGGAAGGVPLIGKPGGLAGLEGGTADPLPQAMVLTAIVITFGVSAFLLALAFRSWLITDEDEVQDDLEDRRVMRLGREEEARRAAESANRAPVEDDA
jgi:multicomponent Na+:H+ antiporter subunit C